MNRVCRRLSLLPVLLLGLSFGAACEDSPEHDWNPAHRAGDPLTQPQARSFFGDALYARKDSAGVVADADALLSREG
ncbi:hypothetical protein [Chromatocurvus halotolerans]|uniref:Uncharacterized protein n=1 Tax=Chromatocurvus halotolerans TaxID=1132028 RepID=A0A4R2KN29_9GAMM|nr:hypothetical protein [Chromatocurvus halotolerans]TCO75551.1 hypothetical protein EV688_108118 [Chromatocurvus halotolerans]